MRISLATGTLLAALAVTVAAAQPPGAHREALGSGGFKAVVFDYLALFNPDSVVSEVERVFPGKGKELTNRWRTRQFEYSWLRSITHQYIDFLAITEDALVYAVDSMRLTLTTNDKRRLLDAYLHLEPWPDTMNALGKLKASGISIVTLANFSPTMLRVNADNAGLTRFFDLFLSTDLNHTYKPDPRAYRLAVEQLGLDKREIVFAAFGGWDAAGAKAFGYPTFWVNRFNQPLERLGNRPDGTAENLDGLLDFVLNRTARQSPGPSLSIAVHAPGIEPAPNIENKTIAGHRRLIGRALGRALSHELGHYLFQSKAHTVRGLMRANWPSDELFSPDPRGFELTAEQREAVEVHGSH